MRNCCYPLHGTCEQCGQPVRGKRYCTKGPMAHKASEPKERKPRPDNREHFRLGDWTERQLKKLGITEDSYKAAKELFGLAPKCNCKKRKKWLNKVSEWWTSRTST